MFSQITGSGVLTRYNQCLDDFNLKVNRMTGTVYEKVIITKTK